MSSMTPFFSITASSSLTASSKVKPYWKPEEPPPVTNTRSLSSGLPSASINVLAFAAAASVKTSGAGISVIAFIRCSLAGAVDYGTDPPVGQCSVAGAAFQLDNGRRFRLGVRQLTLDDRADVHFQRSVQHISMDPRLGLQFQVVVGGHRAVRAAI